MYGYSLRCQYKWVKHPKHLSVTAEFVKMTRGSKITIRQRPVVKNWTTRPSATHANVTLLTLERFLNSDLLKENSVCISYTLCKVTRAACGESGNATG